MKEITLYRGDNGVHEFYESANLTRDHMLILRNHGEGVWIGLFPRVGKGLPSSASLSEVVRTLSERMNARISIDTAQEWREDDNGLGMSLTPTEHITV